MLHGVGPQEAESSSIEESVRLTLGGVYRAVVVLFMQGGEFCCVEGPQWTSRQHVEKTFSVSTSPYTSRQEEEV